jgi:hypothetical protein
MGYNMNGENAMEMNTEQVKSILKYIDALEDSDIRKKIYCKLGEECFHSRHIKQWIESFDGDIQRFLDRVNVEHCCKTFQENMFQTLFKKRVHVEITASAIYGDRRCDTRIYIEE